MVDGFSGRIAIPGNFIFASTRRATRIGRIGKVSLIRKQNDLTLVKGFSKI